VASGYEENLAHNSLEQKARVISNFDLTNTNLDALMLVKSQSFTVLQMTSVYKSDTN
jgi:hypothetical protein